MISHVQLPRLYAILDTSFFTADDALFHYARELALAGVRLLQYRNKHGNSRQMLSHARELRRVVDSAAGVGQATLIMNDRADLCLAAGFDGVHVGQDDLSPEGARMAIGPERWLGISTHNPEQVRIADQTDATYIAVGPVFATRSKANPDPMIGLEGVRVARALTRKPLVAIGGITRKNFREVLEAGADSVAIISDLLEDPKSAGHFETRT
ncbi:MAG: thiamine phosphate synthase [Candidatus Korobacteraceae bacterium]